MTDKEICENLADQLAVLLWQKPRSRNTFKEIAQHYLECAANLQEKRQLWGELNQLSIERSVARTQKDYLCR